MNRALLRLSLVAALLALGASAASADVKIRIAVSPDNIPRCSEGHFFFELGNTGTQPIGVRVGIALMRNGQTVFGPIYGRTRLAAGERRSREFDFFVPALAPLGDYAFVARAEATDGTSDQSTAPFTVVAATGQCPPPTAGTTPEQDMMNGVMGGTGLSPDSPTPTQKPSWGSVKKRYR